MARKLFLTIIIWSGRDWRTHGLTQARTDGRTDEQPENITSLPPTVDRGITARLLTFSNPLVSNGYTSKCSASYWSNSPLIIFFWHSGTLAPRTERQSARMSKKIIKDELDQYGAEHFCRLICHNKKKCGTECLYRITKKQEFLEINTNKASTNCGQIADKAKQTSVKTL